MAGKKIGGISVPDKDADKFERAVIGKYTLVPVGVVLATLVLTVTVMRAFGSERDRILVLETKMQAIVEADSRHDDRLEAMELLLKKINDDLLIIKTKLNADLPASGGSSDVGTGVPNERDKKRLAIKDHVGRSSTAGGTDPRPAGNRGHGRRTGTGSQ